ncbi:unnamed protein product, partial [Heterosigma akashiwo]
TISAHCQKPDLFITFTANPNWPEIQNNLHGQPYTNRPDLVAKVFQMKRQLLLDYIIVSEIFGKVKRPQLSQEWQKHSSLTFI